MDLGKKIKKIRKEQNRNLAEVASICGFSKSLLSKIENGKTVPPIATLIKIAEALGTRVSALLDDHNQAGTVTTTKETSLQGLVKTGNGYSFFAYAVERSDKLMQPFLFVARKDEAKRYMFSHTGEEFIYILEGEMEYKVGNTVYTLCSGDSLYFDSIEEHALTPVSDEVVYLGVFTQSNRQLAAE